VLCTVNSTIETSPRTGSVNELRGLALATFNKHCIPLLLLLLPTTTLKNDAALRFPTLLESSSASVAQRP
jgi:hypothetical protein